jgi:cob(I)alamin adenosyltransferase
MPIYTRTGDRGDTGLFGNRRVAKDHIRIEAYGTVDELNAHVGSVRCEVTDAAFDAQLRSIQDALFDIGADLATEGGAASLPRIEPGIVELEHWIDASEAELAPLRTFVLPGGSRLAALLHVVRTVARRAERRYWTLVGRAAAPPPRPPPPCQPRSASTSTDCRTWPSAGPAAPTTAPA